MKALSVLLLFLILLLAGSGNADAHRRSGGNDDTNHVFIINPKNCQEAEGAFLTMRAAGKLGWVSYGVSEKNARIYDSLLENKYRIQVIRGGRVKADWFACFNDSMRPLITAKYGNDFFTHLRSEAKALQH